MTTDEEFLNRGLPKWPQMIVTGKRLREDLALEIIRRTDSWFVYAGGCNDRAGDVRLAKRFRMPHYFYDFKVNEKVDWKTLDERTNRWKKAWGVIETEYVRNSWVGCAFIHGPHGWCHPDGEIYYIDNVGKWPSVEAIRDEWQSIATAFPFLELMVTLMNGEGGEDNTRPVVAMCVIDGQVRLMEPNIGDHRTPRRDLNSGLAGLLMLENSVRERYPFKEDVLAAWEKKAVEIDMETDA